MSVQEQGPSSDGCAVSYRSHLPVSLSPASHLGTVGVPSSLRTWRNLPYLHHINDTDVAWNATTAGFAGVGDQGRGVLSMLSDGRDALLCHLIEQ